MIQWEAQTLLTLRLCPCLYTQIPTDRQTKPWSFILFSCSLIENQWTTQENLPVSLLLASTVTPTRVQALASTGDRKKCSHVWSESGWAGFGGQVHRGLPRPCASLQPPALPICRLWASADRGGGSFFIYSDSLKAQSLQELLPIPW